MNLLTILSVIVALVTILGGAWAIERHFAKEVQLAELNRQFQQHQIDQSLDTVQQRIWQTEDRLQENPNDNTAQQRLKELNYEKTRLEQRRRDIQKEGK